MTDYFGLVQQASRINNRDEGLALIEVLKAPSAYRASGDVYITVLDLRVVMRGLGQQ